ncbi:hypothetical protein EG329_004160 [Mollisiaceae sp. DMI_Dod_QoI]|nr:hypothetical protein EG329_004160 [Helotiales sp. DMI_Dod_QoI]
MASIVSELRSGVPQKPKDKNRKIQVIGSGLGRTGTMSLSAALETLLNGKVYHTGTIIFQDNEDTMKQWGQIMNPDTLPTSVKFSLNEILAGYVGITDTWGAAMTPELLEMYPDAIVICTIREEEAWWKSWSDMFSNAPPIWMSKIILAPVPVLRYFPYSAEQVWRRLSKLYGFERVRLPEDKEYINVHNEWLKRIVPPKRLHFFSVEEGWEPLCRILDVPVPDEPFPRANEQAAMKELADQIMSQVYARWGAIIGATAVGIAGIIMGFRYIKGL